MKKNQIQLTESEFRKLITESVKRVLREAAYQNQNRQGRMSQQDYAATYAKNNNIDHVYDNNGQLLQNVQDAYNDYVQAWRNTYGSNATIDDYRKIYAYGGKEYRDAGNKINQFKGGKVGIENQNLQYQLAQYKKNAETYKAYYDNVVKNANAWKQHADQWKAKAQQLQAQLNQLNKRGAQPAQRRQAQPAQQQAATQPAQPQANGQNYNGEGQATYGS